MKLTPDAVRFPFGFVFAFPQLNELVLLFDSAKASAEASAAAAAAGGGGDRDGAAGGGGGRAKGKSQMSKAYGRAIESLALYPLQITSAEEALELVGVGDFLAARIGKILMQKLGIRPGDNMAPAAAMDAAPSAMAAAAAPAAKPPRKRKQSPAAAAAADSSAAAAASPIAAASSFHAVVAPLPSSLPSRNNSIPILAPMPTLPATAAAAVAPPTPPPCPFGGLCYRLDPPHFVEQSHPPDHPMAIHGLRAAASSAATGAAHSSAASAKSGWVLLPDDDDTPMRSDDARVVPAAAAPVAVSHRPPPPPFSRPRSAAAGEDDFLEDDEDEDEDDVIDLTSPAPPKATTLASATDASRKPPLHPSSSSSSSSVAPGAAAVAPLFTSSGLAAASAASTAPAAAAASAAAAAPPAAKRARTAAATEKTYKPKLHSSAYALLRGLLDASVAGLGALSKAQLLHEAMRYFKKGSADPDDGGAAAAASPAAAAAANGVSESDLKTSLWSGMSNLVARDLVDKSLTPVTYALTEAGRACIMQFAPAPPRSLPAPSPSPDLSLSSSSPDPHSSPVPSAAASVNAAPARSPSASPPPLPLPFGSPAPPSMRRIFCPSSDFDVVLLIDQRERSGRKDAAFMVEKLSKQGLVCEARSLSVGDFMFVARHRSSSQQSHQPSSSSASSSPGVPPAEVVLDCLVERKRVSDLVSSIRDGRYHEQRARLKKTQLRRILYLIEGPVTQEAVHGLPLATVESVLTSMNVSQPHTHLACGGAFVCVLHVRGVIRAESSRSLSCLCVFPCCAQKRVYTACWCSTRPPSTPR
jgi:hypothetical protein